MISNKKIAKNTSMLLLLNIAKMLFPFITLPYLTRVLSVDKYGVVAYIKAVMNYMQIYIDFGFMLSATKKIIDCSTNSTKHGKVIGETLLSKVILAIPGGAFLVIFSNTNNILKDNLSYVLISYLAVLSSIFLFDFYYRGIEKMELITIRFITMKLISTIATLVYVKSDKDILLIPIFDLLSSLIAVFMVFIDLKKSGVRIVITGLKGALCSLRESAIYFISSIATTAFSAFITIILGITLNAADVAYWSICMQITNAVQAMYTPISDAIYPEMIKYKNIKIVIKILKLFVPIIFVGCVVMFLGAKVFLFILGGKKYVGAELVLKMLVPVMFFGFLSIIFGWPTLGAIDKNKETTITTLIAAIFQVGIIILLIIENKFTLINIAISRSLTEIIFFLCRWYVFKKYRKLFNYD